eukprot:1660751-Rhodomonas_salina.1
MVCSAAVVHMTTRVGSCLPVRLVAYYVLCSSTHTIPTTTTTTTRPSCQKKLRVCNSVCPAQMKETYMQGKGQGVMTQVSKMKEAWGVLITRGEWEQEDHPVKGGVLHTGFVD